MNDEDKYELKDVTFEVMDLNEFREDDIESVLNIMKNYLFYLAKKGFKKIVIYRKGNFLEQELDFIFQKKLEEEKKD